MSIRRLLSTLQADLQRHWSDDRGLLSNVQELVMSQGVWATVVYRCGQWVYEPGPRLKAPAKVAYKVTSKLVEIATGISVPASASIGKGFYIGHFGTIIVHPDTKMGQGCSIGQGVTIGTRGQGDGGVPQFGDNVYLGAGAKVLGGVQIGDNVAVGANAVVVGDVEGDSVAVGIPARPRPKKK